MSDGSVGNPSAISYSSSNISVASVDQRGLIRAVGEGTDTITARVGSLHDELVLTVTYAPITSVAFSIDRESILLDDTLATHAVATNSHNLPAPNAAVTYTSSNSLVASVDVAGRVRALLLGTTKIIAREGSLADTLEITVVPQFIEIALGGAHTCGITGKHRLYCWGADSNGELGGSSPAPICVSQSIVRCSAVPIAVAGGDRFVSMTLGDFHTCALTQGGSAYCWGANFNGAVGIGSKESNVMLPTAVAGGLTFSALGAGRLHTCGVTTSGDTYCWGWDHWGQLGAGSVATDRCDFFVSNSPCSRSPVKVVGGQIFSKVWAAESVSCGQTVAATIFCWGVDVGGTESTGCQSGDISRCTRTPLLQVSGELFPTFGMSYGFRCGQKLDGSIRCWGTDFNNFGNGTGFPFRSSTPVIAAGGKAYEYGSMTLGGSHACGMNSGSVECWGNGFDGQPGGTVGVDRNTPGPVLALGIRFEKIVSGPVSSTSCGIATDGRTYCWGNGRFGQLGNGSMTSSAVPVQVKLVR